jgi:FkbM family methyltransferase
MSFKENFFKENEVKNVLHIGADRGGELPQYKSIGVENVVWVEANPEVYCELIENIKIMNIDDVNSLTFNQLISDKDDVETDFHLYYGWDAGHLVGNKGMSSLLKAKNSSWVSECYKGTIQLKSSTVDTFLKTNKLNYDFDLLNIDTQGAEIKVLKGANDALKMVQYINCEVTFHSATYQGNSTFEEVNSLLETYGFKVVGVDRCLEGNWGDALYIKE